MSKTGKAKSIRRIAKDLELHAEGLYENLEASQKLYTAARTMREAADLLDPPTIKHYTPDF